jgi:hypothetical protein
MTNYNFRKPILVSVLLTLIPMLVFIVAVIVAHFKANEPLTLQELADFATFSGYFSGLANLILIGLLSYLVYQTTVKINNFQMATVLDFQVHPDDHWFMVNCGNATVRNISIRFNIGTEWTKWIACYTLAGGKDRDLKWIRFASEIQVAYCDFQMKDFNLMDYSNLQVQQIRHITKSDFSSILQNRTNAIDLDRIKVSFGSTSPGNFTCVTDIETYKMIFGHLLFDPQPSEF